MVQNHLLQVLSLVAMEPPVSLEAESIRDEKVKLLKSIRPVNVVRGQYVGYRKEPNVRPDSSVETFVAMQVHGDNVELVSSEVMALLIKHGWKRPIA